MLKVFYIFDTFKMVKFWKIIFKDFFFFAKCKMCLRGCLKMFRLNRKKDLKLTSLQNQNRLRNPVMIRKAFVRWWESDGQKRGVRAKESRTRLSLPYCNMIWRTVVLCFVEVCGLLRLVGSQRLMQVQMLMSGFTLSTTKPRVQFTLQGLN